MQKFRVYSTGFIILFCSVFFSSCTNPRWIVSDESEIDPEDYEVISTRQFLDRTGEVRPENPVLTLELLTESKYRYARKVVTRRHVQDYKINWKMLTLSIAGAGVAFWAAHSNSIINNGSRVKSLSLNAAGGLLTLLSILSVQPEGEPRSTGEERYLRTTGTEVVTDTTRVNNPQSSIAFVSLTYADTLLIEKGEFQIEDGTVQIHLGDPLNNLNITSRNPGSTFIEISYSDSIYSYSIPINSILQPYASVDVQITELRNSPSEEEGNVLAELAEGSRLQITGEVNDRWYKVLYGISETYLLKNDTQMIWRTSDFADQNQVISFPTVPFGNIDIESSIPIIDGNNPNGIGLIITIEDYGNRYSPRSYANRDGRLIKSYLKTSLGFNDHNLFHLSDIDKAGTVNSVLDSINTMAGDSTDLIIYLSGYGTLNQRGGELEVGLLLSGETDTLSKARNFELNGLFERIANINTEKTVIFADLDFSQHTPTQEIIREISFFDRPLRSLADQLNEKKQQSAVLFSSRVDQSSHLYSSADGDDKKHHIFPYFLAESIQQRKIRISEIVDHLERNLSYTSRRLHDVAQDPLFFGNGNIRLAE